MNEDAPITPAKMWEARLTLGCSRERLAALSETSVSFITSYEKFGLVNGLMGKGPAFDGLAAIRAALEAANVEFTNGDEPGVMLKRRPE